MANCSFNAGWHVTQFTFVSNVSNAYLLHFLSCLMFECYLSSQHNLHSHILPALEMRE